MPTDTIVAEIEEKERLLSKRKPKQLVFVDEDSIRTESQFHHPVSYLLLILPKSLIMKENSVILIHLMNKIMR